MQNCFQHVEFRRAPQPRPCRCALALLVAFAGLFTETARTEPLVGAWSEGPKSSVRLIAARSRSGPCPWWVGVEIHLAKGALTYWRTPGGAGVAPAFDFAGSQNITKVDVAFPAPTRIEEEGTEVYGYRGDVTFPLRLTPRDPAHPMRLELILSYAVCDRICLPAKADAILDLPVAETPAAPEEAQSLVITRAEASVPRQLSEPEREAMVSIKPVADAEAPTWRVVVHGEPAQDLFAEAADGWYFETKKAEEPGAFLIVQADKPTAARDEPVPVTLTLTGPNLSYAFSAVLDSTTAQR